MRIGVDVGGTFTDLVSWDEETGALRAIKVPSTPPDFHRAVIEAVERARACAGDRSATAAANIVHGSTVATNALLERRVTPVAFITTEGFRDMLLIGRQNRPELYALEIRRPAPITDERNWFTVRERIAADGSVVEPLTDDAIDHLVAAVRNAGVQDVAICLLFSFVNPAHERALRDALERSGMTVTLSSELVPEFREYERASTTAINASLRPIVQRYLAALDIGLGAGSDLRIMHSGGGTLDITHACAQPARLLLSGPAGGVIGAAHVAKLVGFPNVITYDMGGTSTDVATVVGGAPRRTTSSVIDGLPVALPMFDVHTIGAGGGSIAYSDAGGALRVGPRSAGAAPGPACYGRGGALPTVTDANVVLGRIPVDLVKLAGSLTVSHDAAETAIAKLGRELKMSVIDAAIGITRVAESNMAHAVSAVTSRRGLDPRDFALVSFGGAGGLHACAIAEQLDIKTVIVPSYCGVLSALGMVVAAPVAEASQTVLHLSTSGRLDDDRLAAEYGALSGRTLEQVSFDETTTVEALADVRFVGQSHELTVPVARPSVEAIRESFLREYETTYGAAPSSRAVQIVTLRLRRIGRAAEVVLPGITNGSSASVEQTFAEVTLADGAIARCPVLRRDQLLQGAVPQVGPALIVDAEATTFVPPEWGIEARANGTVILTRSRAR